MEMQLKPLLCTISKVLYVFLLFLSFFLFKCHVSFYFHFYTFVIVSTHNGCQ